MAPSAERDMAKLVNDRPGESGRVIEHRMNEDMWPGGDDRAN